jgi:hypothetical protein
MTAIALSGLPVYSEITDIVEALINTEGRRYPIPGMDHEDIAQEIRLECLRVMQHYNPERIGPSPYRFLQVCIRNYLYNMRRGIYVPNNPPCVRCPMWDRMNKTCLVDEIGCDKIVQYRQNMAKKAALKKPASLEIDVYDNNGDSSIDAVMLDESIREALPDHLISYYQQMINGEQVPPRIKRQIRSLVKDILKDDA